MPVHLSAASTALSPSLTRDVQHLILDNGLTVLTKEVRTAPVVSVQIWYRVGSRNEPQGQNGISHQLEHLLFKGTKDRPVQFGRLFSALGSAFNAFTSYDITAYFGTVSQNKLSALLALEADRMLATLITPEQLASEKRVVISELQGYENSPEYRLSRAVLQAAFPGSPYGLPVGGTKEDVDRFTLSAVEYYYHRFYTPENAVLVIVGDFETATALELVRSTFGQLPQGSNPDKNGSGAPVSVVQPLVPTPPIVLREPGSATFLEAVYPLPPITHPDGAAIEILDTILSAGRNSRLYQAVVETGLATSVSTYAAMLIQHGWYDISAIASGGSWFGGQAAPTTIADNGQSLQELDQTILATIAQIQDQPVSAEELERAKTQLQANFILRNRDIDNQASQLAYDQIVAGDYAYSDRYLGALAAVTAADVQRVAQEYLNRERRTIGYFEPTESDGVPLMGGVGIQTSENFSPGVPVDPAEVARYLPDYPAQVASTSQALPERLVLDNGLRVLLLPDASTPTVTLSGFVAAGTQFDPVAKAGLADLTAENLLNGTTTQDALTLAKKLESRGAHLDLNAYREGVDIDGYALAADLPVLLETLAEILQQANFPAKELEISRQQALSELQIELDDPARLGRRVFQQTLFPPGHPFYSFATLESLKAIARADILDFYQRAYRPNRTILTLVGAFEPAAVRSLLETFLGEWQPAPLPLVTAAVTVEFPTQLHYLNPTLPGKSQAITYLGHPGISRHDPRFYAALLANQVLGGDTLSSRLGTEIRDRQGLTYGIYSYFATGQQPGPFLIQMQTAPEDSQRAIQATLSLLHQFQHQGITEAELNTARRSLIDTYPVELANLDNLARTLLHNEVYGLEIEEIRCFCDRLAAVTLEQINQTIRDLIHPDKMVIVTAGPAL